MKTILIIGIIAECIILILLTILKKWTKKTFIAVSATVALCCSLVGIFELRTQRAGKWVDQRAYLYMSSRLIQEDYPTASLEALSAVSDTKTEQYNGSSVRALAYNLNKAYETAKSYLLEKEDTKYEKYILDSSEKREPVSPEVKEKVVQETIDLIEATDQEVGQWEVEMKVRFMDLALNSEDQGNIRSDIAVVRSAVSDHQYKEAYQFLTEKVRPQNTKNAVIVSNMYMKNYDQRVMSDTDEEYGEMWEEAGRLQSQLNLAAANLEDGDTSSEAYRSYQMLQARYNLALDTMNQEAAKRAINYLISMKDTVASKNRLGYQLQLARLYFSSNQFKEAQTCLEQVFIQEPEENKEQWLGLEIRAFREAYIMYLSNPLSSEHNLLFDNLMESLYQSVFDNDNYDSFKEFTFSYLREMFGGFIIRRIDVSHFPEISAEISVAREGMEINKQTVKLNDTGTTVKAFSVTPIPVDDLNIAFVLDRSGSMKGNKLIESKNAIRKCISQMLDNVSLSFITFENSSRLECGITQSKYLISSLVDGINATGGTNIASGLSTAIESLRESDGTRIIILLSDGHDGDNSKALIDGVLSEAVVNDITIFSIGLEGCDEAYLQNISNRTNGQFIMVTNTAELDKTYEEIQTALVNNYQISYRVSGDEESRALVVNSSDSYAQAQRRYSKTEKPLERYEYAGEMQEAGYYKQIGGTGR